MEPSELNQAVDQAVSNAISQQLLMQGGVTSLIVLVALIALRFVLVHIIKGKKEILDKDQRRWINRINNGTTVFIVFALVLIWAPQIQTFALSLTAVAVAVVLITKELIMCLTGGFLRASTKPFSVGDWITVEGITGEVMSISTMTTTLEEIDVKGQTYQFTGQKVQIPNSRFLTANTSNANFVKNYIYHDISITVQYADLDPAMLMAKLQEITEGYYAPFRDEALKFNKKVEKKTAVDFADPEPQYFLRTTDIGHNVYIVKAFIPTHEAFKTGSLVTRDFLSFVHKQKEALEEKHKKDK